MRIQGSLSTEIEGKVSLSPNIQELRWGGPLCRANLWDGRSVSFQSFFGGENLHNGEERSLSRFVLNLIMTLRVCVRGRALWRAFPVIVAGEGRRVLFRLWGGFLSWFLPGRLLGGI